MDVKKWLSEYPGLATEADALYIALERRTIEETMQSEAQVQEIMEKLKGTLDRRDAIRYAVDMLKDPLERCVLRMRYFDSDGPRLTPWREIALFVCNNDAPKDIRYVHRRHKSAVEHLEKIVKAGGYHSADTETQKKPP